MNKIIGLFSIMVLSIFTVTNVFSASLQSDEFNGSGQAISDFWNIKDGDKSDWELKDGSLTVVAGFNANLWANDDSTRYSQTVDQDQFDIETSMIVDYGDGSTVAGLIVYSATSKDSQGRDGEWGHIKAMGTGCCTR